MEKLPMYWFIMAPYETTFWEWRSPSTFTTGAADQWRGLLSKAMKCTSLCLVKGSCTWQRHRCTWSDSEWRRKIYRHKRQTCDDRWVQVVFLCVCVCFFGAPWEVWRCMFGFPFRNLSFHFWWGRKLMLVFFFSPGVNAKNQQSLPMHFMDIRRLIKYPLPTSLDCFFQSSEVQGGTIQPHWKVGEATQHQHHRWVLTFMRWAALVPLHLRAAHVWPQEGFQGLFAGWSTGDMVIQGIHLYEFWKLMNPESPHNTRLVFELSAIRNLTNGCWWAGWFEILAMPWWKLSLHFLVLFMD